MNKKYKPSNDSSFTFDLQPKLFHVDARSPQKTKQIIRSRPPLFWCSLFAFLFATVFFVPPPAFGQAAIEGGALFSSAFELSDGKRANAAEGWKLGVLPTVRAEYWWKKDNPWKFGVVALPFYFRTNQRLTNDLTVEGKNFNAGQNIKLQYQFHNIRGTAAYRLVNKPKSEFRLGASVIVRYANIKITDQTKSVSGTNLIAFPLLFLESRTRLTDTSSLVVRGDTFPTKDIRQGLYDFLVAIEKSSQQAKSRSFSVGVRAFWGGFSPRKVGDNNNEVFFIGPVLRVQF